MKNNIILFFLLFGFSCFAQSSNYIGEYELSFKNTKMIQYYNLKLHKDGTFEFTQYWKQEDNKDWYNGEGFASTGNERGKGKWVYKQGEVKLISDPKMRRNLDYRLNFTGSKIKLKDKNEMQFLESEIFWLRNLNLFRKL